MFTYLIDQVQLNSSALGGIVCSYTKSHVCSEDSLCKSSLNFSCSLVWMGIKRSLQSNELIYAWALKMGDKGSLSNMGSKVCGFGSLYIRLETQKVYYIYRMEELIIL